MIIGATLYAVFVASITAFFADADPSAREYRSKVDMVNQYMRHSQLPRSLRTKLRTYFELRFPGRRAFDEAKILGELSSPLTQEVRMHKCRAVLSALNIVDQDQTLAQEICGFLRRVVFVAGDFIIHENEASDGMYFISSGSVEVVISSSDVPITTLGAHSFFGEMALLAPDGNATASVRVISYFEGYLLVYQDYLKLVHNHPAFYEYLQAAAALRLRTRAEIAGADRDADLNTMFHLLDPTKRKLFKKSEALRKEKAAASTVTTTTHATTSTPGSTEDVTVVARV
jgi:CRP-like cAMP-binding protein